jgi:hypothetical protein
VKPHEPFHKQHGTELLAALLTAALILIVLTVRVPHAVPPQAVPLRAESGPPPPLPFDLVDLPARPGPRTILLEAQAGDLIVLWHNNAMQGCFVVLQPNADTLMLAPKVPCAKEVRP